MRACLCQWCSNEKRLHEAPKWIVLDFSFVTFWIISEMKKSISAFISGMLFIQKIYFAVLKNLKILQGIVLWKLVDSSPHIINRPDIILSCFIIWKLGKQLFISKFLVSNFYGTEVLGFRLRVPLEPRIWPTNCT